MSRFTFILFIMLFCFSCQKEKFDINDPDVGIFVAQLKSGTYNCHEIGGNGENLWLIMPKFTKAHIQSLMDFSKDTSGIEDFPVNPISSRSPFPLGREYYILGECLLWTIEGIRNGNGYGSLDPYLIDTAKPEEVRYKGLSKAEILIVRSYYLEWWKSFKNDNWQDIHPLAETSWKWF